VAELPTPPRRELVHGGEADVVVGIRGELAERVDRRLRRVRQRAARDGVGKDEPHLGGAVA
jgi:hypothetical protein